MILQSANTVCGFASMEFIIRYLLGQCTHNDHYFELENIEILGRRKKPIELFGNLHLIESNKLNITRFLLAKQSGRGEIGKDREKMETVISLKNFCGCLIEKRFF